MKTLFISALFVCCFNASTSFAQSLGIADFIKLRGTSNEEFEKKLEQLNFSLYDEDVQNKHTTQYTYKNENVSENIPFQWVDYLTVKGAHWNNRLSFQIQNIGNLKKYLSEMRDLDFYFISKKVIDGLNYEIYTDGCNTIELITTQSRKVYDNNTYFNFILYNNSEYMYAFATENNKYNVAQIDQNNLYAKLAGVPINSPK